MNKKPTQRQSFELIEYKLDTLMDTVSKGFSRLDNQTTDMLKRISVLEIWQSKVDVDLKNIEHVLQKEDQNEGKSNENLIKIVIIIASALGTALTIILSQVKR